MFVCIFYFADFKIKFNIQNHDNKFPYTKSNIVTFSAASILIRFLNTNVRLLINSNA